MLNNPVRWTDPTGHCVWDLCIIETVAVGTVIITVIGYAGIQYYNYTHPIGGNGSSSKGYHSDSEGNTAPNPPAPTPDPEDPTPRDRVLQTGGHTVKNSTANALNRAHDLKLHSREWGRALESLKKDLGLGNNHHGKLMESGKYIDIRTGKTLGNLLDYLP